MCLCNIIIIHHFIVYYPASQVNFNSNTNDSGIYIVHFFTFDLQMKYELVMIIIYSIH